MLYKYDLRRLVKAPNEYVFLRKSKNHFHDSLEHRVFSSQKPRFNEFGLESDILKN